MDAYASGRLGNIELRLEDADRIIAIGSDRMMAAGRRSVLCLTSAAARDPFRGQLFLQRVLRQAVVENPEIDPVEILILVEA